jgi:hypothetical protein
MIRRTFGGPVIYGISIGIAFIDATACLVLSAVAAAYFTVSYVTSDETSAAAAAAPGGGPRP